MSTTFHHRHSRGVASSRASGNKRTRYGLRVPTEEEVVREIGTVLAVMLAIAFVANLALRVFGID
jgi:hypothetical protein